jgi:hypothetical protein
VNLFPGGNALVDALAAFAGEIDDGAGCDFVPLPLAAAGDREVDVERQEGLAAIGRPVDQRDLLGKEKILDQPGLAVRFEVDFVKRPDLKCAAGFLLDFEAVDRITEQDAAAGIADSAIDFADKGFAAELVEDPAVVTCSPQLLQLALQLLHPALQRLHVEEIGYPRARWVKGRNFLDQRFEVRLESAAAAVENSSAPRSSV